MDLTFFIEGIVVGFGIALPVGPIGILCINRSLSKGVLSGFLTGLGAATADACYGAIAGFGLTFISSFLISNRIYLQIIGIVFLIYLGIKTFGEKPTKLTQKSEKDKNLLKDYLSALGLTITNPMTIISFVAIFAGSGIANTKGNYLSSFLLVLGIFIGSALWWLILSNGAGLIRKKANQNLLAIINKISGIIILIFAIFMILSLIKN